jgi:poly-D-alanine transfer protein DltD
MMMSEAGEEIEELPPQLDKNGNPIIVEVGSKSRTSNTPTLEDLMKKLDKLKAMNRKLRAKDKKGMTYFSSSEYGDSKEEVSK